MDIDSTICFEELSNDHKVKFKYDDTDKKSEKDEKVTNEKLLKISLSQREKPVSRATFATANPVYSYRNPLVPQNSC